MGRLRAVRQKRNPQTTKLSQLKEELRRVSEKLESREGELAEALEQQPAKRDPARDRLATDIQPMLAVRELVKSGKRMK